MPTRLRVQDGSPTQVQRFDALGRVWMQAQLQQDGVWSHVMMEYTARGPLNWQTEPFRGGDVIVSTAFWYDDILGRMTKKVVPKQGEGARGDMVTTYAYAGRTTTIQVCGSADSGTGGCLNLSRTTDSLGRYVETRDALNGRTRFWYEANGNVAAIEDANGVVTKATYNAIGQRTAVNDPNQGSWGFAYNALGEVLAQSDARGIVTQISYDKLGRPQWRTATVDATGDNVADSVQDHWNYDPANAKGAPADYARTINGVLERWTGPTYDSLARPIQTEVTQALASGTQSYRTRTKYDSYYGRPVGQEYPNGEAVQVLYSNYGHAVAEKDPGTGVEYRRGNGVNARGQSTQETFGNGVVLTPTYQLQTGQLTGLTYSKGGTLRQLGYGYDVFGNLKRQSLNGGASREDYSYDQLHRLVQSIRSGAASGTVNYGFDAVGNLTKKSDFSSNTTNAYSYNGGSCGGGANAVKSVQLAAGGTRTYCYDANGNLTSDNAGLVIKYDHQNLPTVAQRGALRDDFRYGADGQRTRSWGSDGARVYLPSYEHRTDTGETKVYIGDYAVISTAGGTRKVEYLLKDRLGSVDSVANSSGAVIETRGYDAFGKPRNGTWNDLSPAKIASVAVTPKGFTQHEHLNQLELIHMNGRAYDYNLGRFTGVDPFIQFPLNSQSLNPYSYILNNPLSGTDPTGYLATGSHIHDSTLGDTGARIDAPMGFADDKFGKPSASLRNDRGKDANGAQSAQTTTGADKRDSKETQAQDKGARQGQQEINTVTVVGLAPNEYTKWNGTIGVVRIGSVVSDPVKGLKFVENTKPSASQLAVAASMASALGEAHEALRKHGSRDEKDGALIDVFVSNRSTAEQQRGARPKPGDVAIAWQAFDSKGAPVFQMLELSRDVYRNASTDARLFVALHELMHFRKATANYSQIRADDMSIKNDPGFSILAPSEIDASARALSLLSRSGWDSKRAGNLPNDFYGKSHMNKAREAVWPK